MRIVRVSTLSVSALPLLLLGLSLPAVQCRSATAQDRTPNQQTPEPPRRQFSFERAPWRTVLEWLAEWADLELHVDTLPTGSFTYSGKEVYSADEAMNRINLFLIPQRFSLVRSGNLLSVISLDDQRSIRQLDAMAVTVRAEELADRGNHELVKCLMPLGEAESNRVLQELGGLMLIRQPVVLPNTNQLLVTDTAGKLRMVQEIIASMTSPDPLIGPVKRFPLGDLDPERALTQIRPHVGLDPLKTIGPDVRLSVDPIGNQLLASGSNENLDAIAGVLRMLEETSATSVSVEPQTFRPHDLGEADMQTVVSVLYTLLADEVDVRMSTDLRSNQIAVMGAERIHQLVDDTIKQLTGNNAVEFHAIPVHSVDPRYAATVLNEMFAQPSAEPGHPEAPSVVPLKIEADILHNRLLVRARPTELAAIERALAELGESDVVESSELRLLPYREERGRLLLESARQFWPHDEELLILPPTDAQKSLPLEREINPEHREEGDGQRAESDATDRAQPRRQAGDLEQVAVLDGERTDQPKIRVQLTSRGLLVHSDDPDVLKRFEEHVRLIAGPAGGEQPRLAVYYLKHAEVDAANLLLQRVLDAETYAAAMTNPGSSLTGALSSFGVDPLSLGNLWTAGTVTVIPDERLNRLFAYGTTEDLLQIEQHLEIIDRESSLAPVRTHGTPHLIALQHARAQDVADVLRDTYAGLIAASAKEVRAAENAQKQNPNGNQPQPTDRRNQEQGSEQTLQQRPDSGGSNGRRQLIKLAVDSPSNTLIVTAPAQLAAEIEQLARVIDKRGAQTVRLISVPAASSARVHDVLRDLYGERIRSKTRTP